MSGAVTARVEPAPVRPGLNIAIGAGAAPVVSPTWTIAGWRLTFVRLGPGQRFDLQADGVHYAKVITGRLAAPDRGVYAKPKVVRDTRLSVDHLLAAGEGALLALLTPWTYRNWRVTGGEFLPVATERGGVTTFIGNYQPSAGSWEGPGKAQWQAAVAEISTQNPGVSVVQLDHVFYRAAWQQIAGNPVQAVGLAIRKCGRFWFFSAKRRELLLAGLIQGGYLALLGFGLWQVPWARERWLLLALIGYVMVVHALSYADLRFSLPIMPCVCALAAGAFVGRGRTGPCQQA